MTVLLRRAVRATRGALTTMAFVRLRSLAHRLVKRPTFRQSFKMVSYPVTTAARLRAADDSRPSWYLTAIVALEGVRRLAEPPKFPK
jgi:hypothetical protein